MGRGRVRSVGTRRRRETSVDADAATRRGIVRPESAVGILRSVAHGGGGARLERRVCRIRPGGMFVDVGRRGWRETRPRRRRGVRGHADDGRADARGCGGFQKRVVRAVAHAGARRGRGGVGVRIGREGERRGVDGADARGVSRANSPPGERRRTRGGDGGERRGAVHVGCRSKRRARTRRDGGRIRAETRATTRRSRRLPRDVRPGIHCRRGIPENHDATRKGGVGKGADAIQIGAGEVGGGDEGDDLGDVERRAVARGVEVTLARKSSRVGAVHAERRDTTRAAAVPGMARCTRSPPGAWPLRARACNGRKIEIPRSSVATRNNTFVTLITPTPPPAPRVTRHHPRAHLTSPHITRAMLHIERRPSLNTPTSVRRAA